MRSLLLATAALLIALPAYAGNWTVNQETSKITFTATQSGQDFTGTLPAFEADIMFMPGDLPGSYIKVVMPLAGMTTDSTTRDADISKPDWFDVTKFPKATFESTDITALDENENEYLAKGTLTIRGISQKVELPFSLTLEDEMAHATGSVSFSRMLFEVGKNWPESSGVSETVHVGVVINAVLAGHVEEEARKPATPALTEPEPETQPISLMPEAR